MKQVQKKHNKVYMLQQLSRVPTLQVIPRSQATTFLLCRNLLEVKKPLIIVITQVNN